MAGTRSRRHRDGDPIARSVPHSTARPNLAAALDNLGIRLAELGEYRPAHEATSEAVALWRALAADDPARQRNLAIALNKPNLAAALDNLGIRLAELGEYRPAHEATSEAVALWRALAADDPAHQPNLAQALTNLGNRLAELGEYRSAHEATSEAG
ncbi:tetratricopeptide repeat protein [Actinoplanes subtropicus]|uniref:tetratricopeptide repeat protein n=1 Tax=Actinoplanes subtropicus TaxID=543632 RepID=UPI0012FCDDF0